jgi:phage I-like protein
MPAQNATPHAQLPALCAGQIVALNAQGEPPEWVMLVPKGPRVVGNDGRVFSLKEPSDVVNAFARAGMHLPIDINHAQFLKAPNGDDSPAAGWIEELDARDGAIWGRVAWTPSGAAALHDRAYRYLSPALLADKDGRVVGLAGAGLVNRPNFNMAALNAEQGAPMKNLFSKLGLPETASENDAIAAVDRLQTALNAAQTPSLDRFVPRGEFDRINGELIALNARVEGDRKAARDKEVTAFIETAVKEGKVFPASREHFLALSATDAGFEQVKALVAASASFFKPANLDERALEGAESVALNARERELLALTQLNEAEFIEAKKAEAAKTRTA